MSSAFSNVPEEVIEHILSLVLIPPPPRANWQPYARRLTTPSSPPPIVSTFNLLSSKVSTLLVSHQFLRIATPIYYRHIVLQNSRQASLLATLFEAQPQLASCVRTLVLEGAFSDLKRITPLCHGLEELDMVLEDNDAQTIGNFGEGLDMIGNLRKLTVRKKGYLTNASVGHTFQRLAEGINRWTSLEFVHIALRFSIIVSPTPATSPTAAFALALANANRLRVVHAELPTLWNSVLLEISANPSVESIHLTAPTPSQAASLTTTSSLYLSEARKHPRLMELIKAGTILGRGRAWTTVATHTPSPPSSVTSVLPSPRPSISPPTPHIPDQATNAPSFRRTHLKKSSQPMTIVIPPSGGDVKGVNLGSPSTRKSKGRTSRSAV